MWDPPNYFQAPKLHFHQEVQFSWVHRNTFWGSHAWFGSVFPSGVCRQNGKKRATLWNLPTNKMSKMQQDRQKAIYFVTWVHWFPSTLWEITCCEEWSTFTSLILKLISLQIMILVTRIIICSVSAMYCRTYLQWPTKNIFSWFLGIFGLLSPKMASVSLIWF